MTNADVLSPAGLSISVIVCTYNRSASLAATLESLAASQLPASVPWEVMVVDNNSTDTTREVVETFRRRHPQVFRYLFEPRSGKSNALNTGIKHAQGKVLAFVDDDVTVESTWLHHLTASLHDEEWSGAGGRILPARAFGRPAWFSLEELGGILFGHFDFGDQPRELGRAPFGANMAFRKEMFERYGGFQVDLGPGPDPGTTRLNEDTEFGRRLISAGERLRYEPSAAVYHPVAPDRLNQKFFLVWWFDYGRSRVREHKRRSKVWGINRDYARISKDLLLHLPLATGRWMFSLSPKERFRHKCGVWHTAGRIAESCHRAFYAAKPQEWPRRVRRNDPQRNEV